MQVDPSPMNVGDGGPVSRESSAPAQASESMVGNPQQTLPPELRGDVPHSQQNKLRTSTDCKAPGVCSEAGKASKASNSNHCPEVPPSQPHNNAPVFSTDPLSTPLPDRTEVPKAKADGGGIYSTHHWPCGKKVGVEDSVNSVHGGITANKKTPQSPSHTPPVISLPPGFQCSTLFKTGQPVAFLPSPNFSSSPLCKITLPPGLGQIAALREATASQFQKDCAAPSSGSSMPPRLKTYPSYHFSVGRSLASDKKPLSPASKGRSDSLSNAAKGCKSVGEHKSTVPSASNPAIVPPVQQSSQSTAPPTRYTISPTAAICCSSALANISTQSRLLSLVEKCPSYRGVEKTMAFLKPKTSTSSAEEHNTPCSPEERDVPLDLSSKSKRQKSIRDAQNASTASEHHPAEPHHHQKNMHTSKRPQTATFGTANAYSLLPDTQRNGAAPQRSSSKLSNHHSLEPSASWGKGSSPCSLNSLPGTYVGVASPILASTLRSKDGKSAAFVDDLQTFAKQETISIIDQGEQLVSRGKKAAPSSAGKGNQLNKGTKHSAHSASASSLGSPEHLSTALFVTANSELRSSRKSSLGGKAGIPYTPPVIKPSWQQQPNVHTQETSTQKQLSQTQPPSKAVRSSMACETPLFHSSDLSPTKLVDDKWEKAKSPLSNLESIVKQKALETTALTAENYCNLTSAGSRKPEVLNLLNRCQNPPLLPNVTTSFTPSRVSEPQDSRSDRISPPKEVIPPVNRPEATTTSIVPKEKKRDKPTKQTEHVTGDSSSQKSKPSTPKKKCASGIKAGKKDNKLVQSLDQDLIKKEPTAQTESSTPSKLEGIALSDLHPQTETVTEAEDENKTNSAKEESPSKGKVPVTKQKRAKKLAKEKMSPANEKTPKKTATLMKKQQEKESATVAQGSTSKKKKDVSSPEEKSPQKVEKSPIKVEKSPQKVEKCPNKVEKSPKKVEKSPIKVEKSQIKAEKSQQKLEKIPLKVEKSPVKVENSPQKEESTCSSPEPVRKIRKGKSSAVKKERPVPNKSGFESSPVDSTQCDQREEDPSTLSSPVRPSKDSQESQVEASPRLRRGRRRTDEALLKDWSFASPPTPPPPDPPASPTSPSHTATVTPLRRPRGRPRLNRRRDESDASKGRAADGGDSASAKKRKRCRNRKYQNGEYITEKDKPAEGEKEERLGEDEESTDEKSDLYPSLSATLTCETPSSDLSPRRSLYTRSGTTRRQESPPTPEFNDKPPGKRKFKSKHLCDTEEQKKLKTKRSYLGKRCSSLSADEESPVAKKPPAPFAVPKGPSSPVLKRKGPGRSGTPESTPSRPVPPEVRRLIVNKNAGETLLQRAARLGYQEVVLYCLEKDVREVNRRDNAGYTALHEACARGWTHIVQVLLKHGADVNCSAQDGTRPIHDAVAADNLASVWMLLNHGADPTLATYSGQTAVKLAQSPSMKTFLKEYFTDLEGRTDQDPSLQWDFYSSSVFETEQEACWDFLLSQPEEQDGEESREQGKERDSDSDCLMFEFSSEPLLPCYHVQVSLTQGFCNWFLLADVLKRLKVSARIFRARYPQFEVASIAKAELWKQMTVSQTCLAPEDLRPAEEEEEEEEEAVELVRCVPELQGLLGSSIQLLREDEDERTETTETTETPARLCSR
ncbi:BCL-6 corepressor-like protein 1 isoform X2 [Astyanax mexicanus]|uniref:BCL-6 corepressor-like protein 1 isoform X2 n=1 Tax=Astyanax mexicanus TaxID=7994 RepID=UPI0020CB47C0|nr:BCL-6 corepressor-like protein 1 isoform X2 [Astyanax mexicanus]